MSETTEWTTWLRTPEIAALSHHAPKQVPAPRLRGRNKTPLERELAERERMYELNIDGAA